MKLKLSLKRKARQDRLLPRVSLFFYKKPLLTFLMWIALVGFGIASYAVFMGRQGFPAVQAPLSIVNGAYFVGDARKVDKEISAPISEIALRQDNVKTVSATSDNNTFGLFVQYENGTDPKLANQALQDAVTKSGRLPKTAIVNFKTLDVSKYTTSDGESYDILISYFNSDSSTLQLAKGAEEYAAKLQDRHLSLVSSVAVVDPFEEGVNSRTGKPDMIQTSFDRYGEKVNGQTIFHNDVVIGIKAVSGADTVKTYDQVKKAIDEINSDPALKGHRAAVTASFGPTIQQEVNELQKSLLEGLVAVVVVGTILIALRASLLTIISMLSVIAITIGVLNVIGYTINVITLFSLILGLSLIVDDTIIMTEALDVERRRHKNAADVVKAATRKVSLAMLAATSTAVLGFAPIIFVSGILGGFIRPIPITIIISLLVSLFVALTIIPTVARVLILYKKHLGPRVRDPLPVRLQETFAHKLTAPLRWAKGSSKRLWLLGISALIIGFGFIGAGGYIFKYVEFNTFPSNKDSNMLSVNMQFPAGTDIARAEAVTDQANRIIASTLGDNISQVAYYGAASTQGAQAYIDLKPYDKRDIKAPELVDQLKASLKELKGVSSVVVDQANTGGPPGEFNVFIETTDQANAMKLANDMAKFLQGKELKRPDGSTAHITKALVSNPSSVHRQDNKEYVGVSAKFDGKDTTTLVDLAQKLVEKEYTNEKLAPYHLKTANIVFNFGFEEENQESFNSMLKAFPILLALMFILLALEFRSLLQPLLIFMAIPFSFFGVTGGLWLTDNAFSFFTMLGFFALVGLSVKNTILLTDYADQARHAGMGRVDSIASAVEERFRPLVATSATAVFSLLPLALTSPFWESLAFTLIFGLLSSTTLVLLVFPYYYLGGEYLRMRISRWGFFRWVLLGVIIIGGLLLAGLSLSSGIYSFVGVNVMWLIYKKFYRRK